MGDYLTNIKTGLLPEEVKERIEKKLVNKDTKVYTKSAFEIISMNIFTLFNFLNATLATFVLLVGSIKNVAFMGVVICNTLIGIIQELNAKRIVDKLSLISATKAKVIRGGKEEKISLNEVVVDDLVILESGNQVFCDSIILEGSCEVNESLITGESDPVYKKVGDEILSGSFIVSGKVKTQVKSVGKDNYAAIITSEAKTVRVKKSKILNSLNKIIKTISFVIVPLGIILFLKQISLENNVLQNAVINTVAALIGMIPEGLILLTSTVFAVSVIRLARYRVSIQQLHSVEMLARIDILCLDKTGTLTDGNVEFVDFIKIDDDVNEREILSALALHLDSNATTNALKEKFCLDVSWEVDDIIPFSSSRKWSGVSFKKIGTFVIGAFEFVVKNQDEKIKKIVNKYSSNYRVLLLAKSNYGFNGRKLPKNLKVLGLILLRDNIRKEAIKTLEYFKEQEVDLKIISGDNVLTVLDIVRRLGLDITNNYIDASTIANDQEMREAALKYDIFGRTNPHQKKIIVETLQESGKTVGFVGDGVNDVLALKQADCAIALGSGSDASKSVSEVVLLDSNFDAMPHVVHEGRRTINNIQRSATLFLVKTIYATVLAIIFLFINLPYPYEPIQLSLTSVFTIGIPAFILAIEPNNEKVKGSFLTNVISRAMPAALTNVVSTMLIMIIGLVLGLTLKETTTLSVILIAFMGFMLLYKISYPFNLVRKMLMVFVILGFLSGVLGAPNLFSLTELTLKLWIIIVILIGVAIFNFKFFTNLYYKVRKKYPKYFE